MNEKKFDHLSSYQQNLPPILQEDIFIGRFLLAFEKILSGLDRTPIQEKIINTRERGLEEIIDNIHLYFNPQQTPEEFLPWLAGWVALSLRDDWKEEVKRAFIQKIVGLYRLRGTKTGLTEILKLYLKNSGFGENVEVFDQFDNFPNYFQVQLTLPDRDPDKYWRQAKIAKAIIDREKPAQTFYTLKILVPTMQITLPSSLAFPFKLSENTNVIASVEKLNLEAIIEITKPSTITIDLLNKIIVRFKDNFSDYHLFTPEMMIVNNQIRIKRTIEYEQFIQSSSKLEVTLTNLNNIEIGGQVVVNVTSNINQVSSTSTYQLLKQPFNLAATPPYKILQICRKNQQGEIIKGETIATILGTTSQSLS